jgi:hypothetical protein
MISPIISYDMMRIGTTSRPSLNRNEWLTGGSDWKYENGNMAVSRTGDDGYTSINILCTLVQNIDIEITVITVLSLLIMQ